MTKRGTGQVHGVAMALREYKSKRKFEKTPEPDATEPAKQDHRIFVIHKHAARALHYDLRLELDGVLKSWAVPKGPSLDPTIKRLAVLVEDHPFEYKDFEGVIPDGNYGAGSVIIWDRGFYRHPSAKNEQENETLLREGFKKGDLKFVLHGEKLRGEFALVKMHHDPKTWLLMKKKDGFASTEEVLAQNRSVVTGNTLETVSEAAPEQPSHQRSISRIRAREARESADLVDAPMKEMPRGVQPMLASSAKQAFDHRDWLFEVKWDGYRAIAEIRETGVTLYSRNGISFMKKFASIAEALKKFDFEAVLDGEIVMMDDEGRPDFQALQHAKLSRKSRLVYCVFDLLYFQGRDLTGLPLLRRKELLKKILPPLPNIRFSDHVMSEGTLFLKVSREKGLEGIMAKHSQSLYEPGKRSSQWQKIKTRLTQDAVIAGFTEGEGSRKDLSALVLGVCEGNELVFIGHVGSGFSEKDLKAMRETLSPLIREECPFPNKPETNNPVTWVKPVLVCEVEFAGWTEDKSMRQPVFLRLRDDKAARDVVREMVVEEHGGVS
jgi:bifunctional non-homologous end joining protein LigD